MRISRYTGSTIQQALARVKAALGPDAVILEATSAPGAPTVTAAIDGAPVISASGSGELLSEVRQLVGVVRDLVEDHWRHDAAGPATPHRLASCLLAAARGEDQA